MSEVVKLFFHNMVAMVTCSLSLHLPFSASPKWIHRISHFQECHPQWPIAIQDWWFVERHLWKCRGNDRHCERHQSWTCHSCAGQPFRPAFGWKLAVSRVIMFLFPLAMHREHDDVIQLRTTSSLHVLNDVWGRVLNPPYISSTKYPDLCTLQTVCKAQIVRPNADGIELHCV